ncbi:inositol monophosphatase family protein [Nocardioides marmoribigeumensis]|uniref:Inositol-1-monophosphatase n=1 Tax=Nocardioides marmoribigeumensis TaxID=433649 RepID=A0ABU2BRA3_9ACTN|nr:inositol monophosphatase family protein [Nocardioides marmoribigeumensis]MDR7361156.1 myo-inositol-1(or 4)-monophosphatase [Nocardioides marmoribigeumensis]
MAGADRQELRGLAERLALEAAELARRRREEGVSVAATKSSDTDVVTETDREVERLLRDRLAALRPGDGFVGEEGSSADPTEAGGVSWVVDPIDGTVNFLYGLPSVAVSIAAQEDGTVVAGAVVNVFTGTSYTAALGHGATRDGRPLRVRAVPPMPERLVLTGFSYEPERRVLQGRAVASLLGRVRDIRRQGSAALELCAVAEGAADAYLEEGLNLWDHAAGGLVAQEAGARVGHHPGAGGTDCVVAAPASSYDEMVALARECGFLAGGSSPRG